MSEHTVTLSDREVRALRNAAEMTSSVFEAAGVRVDPGLLPHDCTVTPLHSAQMKLEMLMVMEGVER